MKIRRKNKKQTKDHQKMKKNITKKISIKDIFHKPEKKNAKIQNNKPKTTKDKRNIKADRKHTK